MKVIKNEVLSQIKFCKELMDRLYADCIENMNHHQDDNYRYFSYHKGTTMAQDSIRLRRELNVFNKMVTDTGEKYGK